MKAVLDRKDVLKILVVNKENHQKIFEEAIEGYRKEAIKYLNKQVNKVKDGGYPDQYFPYQRPVNQTKEYNRVIKMFEMTNQEEITLDETEFGNYILDEWGWTKQFLATNSVYSLSAATKMKEVETDDD